ncbi:hypothetical protein [Gimesia fumaroli]|uniref:Uncharacterized protein n=1 Tax=Gimesia fumaroli TaxID=2527976 RepID=A0A518IJP3_9PLAN|nr:hypothetical protein [Gimesia fumaroli]QDV53323.1 hypothetical protein Enr17x_53970 [Gimesia fumaroli]
MAVSDGNETTISLWPPLALSLGNLGALAGCESVKIQTICFSTKGNCPLQTASCCKGVEVSGTIKSKYTPIRFVVTLITVSGEGFTEKKRKHTSSRIEFEIQMKLIRLLLIALLLQPCPVCWGHGFADREHAAHGESEATVSAPACCAHCAHSQPTCENDLTQTHDEHHDCPCFCHLSEIVFAQTTPAVHLRGVTVPLNVVVDPCCLSAFTTASKNSDVESSRLPVTVPLRI